MRISGNQRGYSALKSTGVAVTLGAVLNTAGPILPTTANETGLAEAQTIDGGGRARMNVAGNLLALGQTVAAAACMIDQGYDSKHERELLSEAHEDFNRALWALEHGDMNVDVPTPEHFSQAVLAITEIHRIWEPMDASAVKLLEGDHPQEHAMLIAVNNQALLEQTTFLSSIIVNEYANPFETQMADALAISMAERQATFSEKLKREACEIGGGHAGAEIVDDFNAKISMFGATLNALHDGYPAAGIRPPPNEAIKHHLEQAMEEWHAFSPKLAAVAANGGATEEEMIEIRKVTEHLEHRMHGTVIEYLLAAPGANDMLVGLMSAYADSVLAEWVEDPTLIAAIKAHNAVSAGYSLDELYALDAAWSEELAAGHGPMISEIETHPASVRLHEIKSSTSGIVTEGFIMDIRGLNVAESAPTPHFFHGDQARWRNIVEGIDQDIYISEVHLAQDSEAYQVEMSIPIKDPDTLALIGVATFGVSVQAMF